MKFHIESIMTPSGVMWLVCDHRGRDMGKPFSNFHLAKAKSDRLNNGETAMYKPRFTPRGLPFSSRVTR